MTILLWVILTLILVVLLAVLRKYTKHLFGLALAGGIFLLVGGLLWLLVTFGLSAAWDAIPTPECLNKEGVKKACLDTSSWISWMEGSWWHWLLGALVLGIVGYGIYRFLKREVKPAPTEQKTETHGKEKEGGSIASNIFKALFILAILAMAWYVGDSNDWFSFDVLQEHWFLALMAIGLLLLVIILGWSRPILIAAGILVMALLVYITWLSHGGGGSHAKAKVKECPGICSYVELPADGKWHTLDIPTGWKLLTYTCPANADLHMEGPYMPGGGDTIDCATGKTFDFPEKYFWGAKIEFRAKADPTRVSFTLVRNP